jgi:7-cyano-7-deazaguanine synthase in queuosine biosynthesis
MFIVQAITTKYTGPGNVRGARIIAKAAAGRVTMPYDHALNIEANHAKAAEKLARKFGWTGSYYQGGMPDDSGYCFVCVDRDPVPAFSIAKEG